MPRKKENELKVVNIRLVKEPSLYSDEPIQSSEDVMKLIAKELASYDREVFLIVNLKLNGQVINMNVCSVGTLTNSLVSARDVFKSAILSNAGAFIAVHNHPTGGLEPSQEDKDITKMLIKAGKIMDIKMVDHIIVAGESGKMFSFQREGLMEQLEWQRGDWER